MNGAASAIKLASPAPTSARAANAHPHVGASAHPSSPTAAIASPIAINLNAHALFAIALNAGAPESSPIMNAAFSAPYAAYEHPSAPCKPRPAGSRALLGAPLTAAELAIPRSTYTSALTSMKSPRSASALGRSGGALALCASALPTR